MPGKDGSPNRDGVQLMNVLDMLSHDLGNSTQEILARLEIADARGKNSASLEEIGRRVSSMHRMVHNTRLAVRAGNTPYKPETLNLFKIVQGAREKVLRHCGSAPEVDLDSAEEGLTVRADEMLQDALAELMLNSIRSGGKKPCRVSISYERTSGHVRISIADDSPNADLSRIKLALHRLDSLMDGGNFHGSGTGLSMVNAIVRRYGGSIKIAHRTKDPSSGVRFTIDLPM